MSAANFKISFGPTKWLDSCKLKFSRSFRSIAVDVSTHMLQRYVGPTGALEGGDRRSVGWTFAGHVFSST